MMTVKRHAPTFLNISAHLLEQGLCVQFHAEGTSMRPAIEDGDTITVGPVAALAIRIGDIVLYRHLDRPIAHRVADIYTAGGGVVVVPRGDAKAGFDAPVESERILGKVIAVKRRTRSRATSIFESSLALAISLLGIARNFSI
jgi:signal peptidase I